MKTLLRFIGAMLLALVLLPAAALASSSTHQLIAHHSGAILAVVFGLGAFALGTVTITYSSFAADNPAPQVGPAFAGGSTTPPTQIQSSNINRVNALVAFTDSDTTITFTHNMALSAAGAAANEPDLIVYDTALGSSTTTPSGITWNVANTNVVVGTKANTAGSGRTISITARRPSSPGN